MPRTVWRPLDVVAKELPVKLPLMLAPTGLNRVPPEPQQAPNNVQLLPHANLFPPPDPAPPVAALADEVSLEGMSVQDEIGLVKKKIKDALELDEKNSEQLRKLARELSFLEETAENVAEDE